MRFVKNHHFAARSGWCVAHHLTQFANLINAGNTSNEDGNLVFEIVCHYTVSQADAKPSCLGFRDHTVIPPIGSHVAITGTLVKEKNHAHWNEIHPVSRIVQQ